MQLFIHDVGREGAARDFPRTVFGDVRLETVERHVPGHLKAEVVTTLGELFPSGTFNCWGVPSGAARAGVVNRLRVGDAVLLIRTTGGRGDIPALCVVKAYWREEMLELSQALWGSANFPYIFFFETQEIELTWVDFKNHVGYEPNYRLGGSMSRVREERLERVGGAREYISTIRRARSGATPPQTDAPGGRAVERVFGHIPGYPVGSAFGSRAELSTAGVHVPQHADISGSAAEGADSILLSGGHEDDQDLGDIIIYTGHGGRDQATGQQITDQTLTAENLALAKNKTLGLPVRVVRGSNHRSPSSPPSGYRYDGSYRVDDHWHERARAGFEVWRFRLVKLEDEAAPETEAEAPLGGGQQQPQRRATTTLRVVRDTKQAKKLKHLYDYTCQVEVCGVRLAGPAGPYAEAAHIRPLGAPHNGPDSPDNLLCLCPNHHVLFDLGGFSIADDLTLIGLPGRLTVNTRHEISREHLRYHREHYSVRSD